MIQELQVNHYPFTLEENEKNVRAGIGKELKKLLSTTTLDQLQQDSLYFGLTRHLGQAESLFVPEEEARRRGEPQANLFYHRKEHAVYQAAYDAITATKAVLDRCDAMSSHLTSEGVAAIVLAAMYHDTGYVSTMEEPDNYAARTPIHVRESIKTALKTLTHMPLPSFMDGERICQLIEIGIFQTNFPFTEAHKQELREKLDQMAPEQRKEAHIVRLLVQLADLGGQAAREDYFLQLKALREEMNSANPGTEIGTQIIGKDEEMATKCEGFINFVVKPIVGKTANAFFGTKDHTYKKSWEKQGKKVLVFQRR